MDLHNPLYPIGFYQLSCCCSCKTSDSNQWSWCTSDSVGKASSCAVRSIKDNTASQPSAKSTLFSTLSSKIFQKSTAQSSTDLSTDGLSALKEDTTSITPSITQERTGTINKTYNLCDKGERF